MENPNRPLCELFQGLHEDLEGIKLNMEVMHHIIHDEHVTTTSNKHKEEATHVTINPGISAGEKEFLQKRLPIVKAALERKFNCQLTDNQIPSIALISSGGGYRAMLYLAGILNRLSKGGLLDTLTYITALSGSTWTLVPWIMSGKSPEDFKTYIQECASKPIAKVEHKEKILMAKTIAVKSISGQARTLVDIYGDLLGNRLLKCLGDARHSLCLSDLAPRVESGKYPYPICIAIDGRDREAAIESPTIFEYTVHTVAEHTNHTSIPSWGNGRKYKYGNSTNNTPEKSLSYNLGTWGSAFGADIKKILKEIFHNHPEILEFLEEICKPITGIRPFPCYAKLPNYKYQMDIPTITDKTLLEDKNMIRVDAGLANNLPFAPVSGICAERSPDILIFNDVSAGKIGKVFKKVINYALKHNIPVPDDIDVTTIGKETISIFKKNDKVFIYMPRISDQALWEQCKDKPEFKHYNLSGFDLDYETNHGFAASKNFQYTIPHSTLLMNQAEFNLHTSEDKIWQAIEWKINQKSS